MRAINDKYIVTLVLMIYLVLSCFGQTVRPDQFPLEANPNNSNFEVYSQKGGVNKRTTLNALRTYILQGVTAGPAGPQGLTGPQGLVGPQGPAGSGGSGTPQNLSNGGKSGYNQTVNISGGTGVTFDVRDADADSLNERQVLAITNLGAWSLTKSGGTGNIKNGVTYSNDSLKLWGYVANFRPHINRAYQVADTVARNAIASPRRGSVAIIANADGDNTQGLSFYDSISWRSPVLVNKKVSFQYMATQGGTTAIIWATGTGVTINTNETTGECNVMIPTNVHLKKLHITLPFGAVDGSNNYYVKLDYTGVRTYNTRISNINLPSVLVGSAVTTSMSRSSPVLFSPNGNAGVDVGVSAIGTGDGSDLEIAIKDFLLATTQFVTLNFSTN
jgi:hypothetical protein